MKPWKIGMIAGGLAGFIGALMINENFSLFWIMITGALVGFAIGTINKFLNKRK